jgi:hypothetical protein
VNLSAGTTGVVIPGVTQAVNYRVEEVDERDGANPDIFGSDEGAVTVIDNAGYVYRSGGAQPSGSYTPATYVVDELDDGEIEEIGVDGNGVFAAADKTRAEAANMWATTTPTPFVSFNTANWTQIPFRPKFRAGEVENVGGGNANTGDFTFSEDTITNSDGLILNTSRGTLAIGTNMEVPGVAQHFHIAFDGSNSNPPASDLFLGDDNNYVKLPGYELNPTAQFGVEIGTDNRNLGPQNIEVSTVDELVPPGGVWRFFIDHEDYPNLGSSVSVGDTVTTSWGTPITATITDVIEEPGNWWKIHVAQNITAGFSGGDTVSFSASGLSHTWRFGTDGVLTLPNDMTIDASVSFGIVTIGGTSTYISIDNGGAPPALTIATNQGENEWQFGYDGTLTFPDGTIQTTAYTGQTSGGNTIVRYVAVHSNGIVYGSSDGENWTPYTSIMDNIDRVAVGPTNIVYVADRTVGSGESLWYATAYDATPVEVAPSEGVVEYYNEVKYFSSIGKYIAVGYVDEDGTDNIPLLLHSSDGVTWTRSYVDPGLLSESEPGNVEFVDIAENDLGFFIISDENLLGSFFLENITDALDATTLVDQADDYEHVVWVETAAAGFRGWHVFDNDQDWYYNANEDPRVGSFALFDFEDLDDIFEAAVGYSDGPSEIVVGDYNGVSTIVIGTGDGQIMRWPATAATPTVVIPKPYTATISAWTSAVESVITVTGESASNNEKFFVSGSSVTAYNGTYYIDSNNNKVYTDIGLTTPFNTTGLSAFTGTATITWSHGQYIDALHYSNGVFYAGNDSEEFFISTNGGATWTETDAFTDDNNPNSGYPEDIDSYSTTGDIGDIVVTVDDNEGFTKLTLANKDFTLETTRTGTQDADINLTAADDIFIEANGDDISLSAADQVRIRTDWNSNDDPEEYHTWTFDNVGHIEFPDGSIQTTAYANSDVWVKEFKTSLGTADTPTMAISVEYLPDGDIVALFTHSEDTGGGFTGAYSSVARINSAGAQVWSMSFKGAQFTNGWGLAVDRVNGSIYVAGTSSVGGLGAYDIATLTKLNQTNGNELWSQAYDVGVGNSNTVVDVASDGSPVVVGYVGGGEGEADAKVVTSKINDSTGAITWSRALDGQGDEYAYGMAVGPNDEVVTVGWMTQLGATDAAATLYTDPVSNPNWTTGTSVTGGSGATYTVSFTGGVPTFTNIVDPVGGRTVDQTLDTIVGASFGGVTGVDDMIVKVGTVSNETDDRMLIVKYNSVGAIQWQKAVQVNVGYDCKGADADIDSAGNIYVCGNFYYDNNGQEFQAMIIIKFNSLGVKQWTRKLIGPCGDFATSIVVGPDNFLYLSAVTIGNQSNDINMVIAKYDTDGNVEWQRLLNNTGNSVFAGEFFVGGPTAGGSNLAVKDGYVAVGGGFGNPDEFPYTLPNAIVAQFLSHGTEFLAGTFEFEAAGFSGSLDDTASNITVVDAGKTSSDYILEFTVTDFNPTVDLTSDLIGTLYHGVGGENRIFNGGQSLVLETTGAVTLPKGGTVTEGVVTSNPTIQLTPARPDVASQKLVIKGGNSVIDTVINNGIQLRVNDLNVTVGDTVTFYIENSNTYANQTLYWWTYPENLGVADADFGTVTLDGDGDGTFTILVDRDDYEFTVRVSPIDGQYDPDNVGVESRLINASEPTYPDYHLHLTTGNLTETSIFLGTDDHNVRTTTDGGVQITTGGQFNICTILNAGSGYASGDPVPAQTTGGTGTGMTADFGYGISGQLVSVSVNNPGTGYTNGDVITVGGGTGTFVLTRYNALANQSNGNSFQSAWNFSADGALTFPDDTVQTTAYPGITTVAKDGPTLPTTSGVVDTLAHDSVLTGLTNGIYGPFTRDVVTFSVTVSGGVINSLSNITVSGDLPVNAVIGTIDSGDIGGTAGTTITITVASVVQATPVAIDLTKTVNKLAGGFYTLANGTEGQIMYLVRQTGTVFDTVTVTVANARVNGVLYTNLEHYPFIYATSSIDIDTLIFTDGAWQAVGGEWD